MPRPNWDECQFWSWKPTFIDSIILRIPQIEHTVKDHEVGHPRGKGPWSRIYGLCHLLRSVNGWTSVLRCGTDSKNVEMIGWSDWVDDLPRGPPIWKWWGSGPLKALQSNCCYNCFYYSATSFAHILPISKNILGILEHSWPILQPKVWTSHDY
jgi:hypothetical protein